MKKPLIFDIKRYAINDGPGIRVSIFFKGCPLDCAWCHNPESKKRDQDRSYQKGRCIGDQTCINNCPTGALSLSSNGIITDKEQCTICGNCAFICPTNAIEMIGNEITSTDIVKEVDKERLFIDQSKGGVTFTGGEPMLYPHFLKEVLIKCKAKDYHTAVDTSGFCSLESIMDISKYTDLFLYDLKSIDPATHKKWTAVDNSTILSNIRWLSDNGSAIEIRIPFIDGVNTSDREISLFGQFISTLNSNIKVRVLPYHDIAKHKVVRYGEEVIEHPIGVPTASQIEKIKSVLGDRVIE